MKACLNCEVIVTCTCGHARAERAEAEVARLRSAGRRLLDALAEHSCEDQGRSEELMLADATLEDALATTSASTVTPCPTCGKPTERHPLTTANMLVYCSDACCEAGRDR